MSALILISILCWTLVSLIFFKMGYRGSYSDHLDEPRTKTNLNAIALFLNVRDGDFEIPKIPKRKSGIDKEIAEEEKEIEELEQQKEKINKLHRLKRRKEELFEQVKEYSE